MSTLIKSLLRLLLFGRFMSSISSTNLTGQILVIRSLILQNDCTIILVNIPHEVATALSEDSAKPVLQLNVDDLANAWKPELISDASNSDCGQIISFDGHVLEHVEILKNFYQKDIHIFDDLTSKNLSRHDFAVNVWNYQVLNADGSKIGIRKKCSTDHHLGKEFSANLDLSSMPTSFPIHLCDHPLQNAHLRVSFNGPPPYIIFKATDIQGVDIEVLNILAEHFGFTFTLSKSDTWLDRDADGDLIGIVPEVAGNQSQLGIGLVHLTLGHYELVDFAGLLYPLTVYVISPKAKPLKPYWNLIKPFEFQIWIGLILTMTIVFILLNLFYKFFSRYTEYKIRILDVFKMIFSQASSYDYGKNPTSLTLVVLGWIFFTYFIAFSYESNLRAYLMSVDLEETLDSEEDILRLGKRFYIPKGTFFEPLLEFSPYDYQRKLYEDIVNRNLTFHYVKGLRPLELEKDILKNGDSFPLDEYMALAAFPIMEERHGYHAWRIGEKVITTTHNGFVIQKHQAWHHDIFLKIERMKSAGIVDHIKKSYIKNEILIQHKAEAKTKSTPDPLEIGHILGGLIIWTILMIASVILFAIETHCYSK